MYLCMIIGHGKKNKGYSVLIRCKTNFTNFSDHLWFKLANKHSLKINSGHVVNRTPNKKLIN